jgi:hypothetical protein
MPKGSVMNRNHVTAILCILALAGCATSNRYELSKDNAGRLVRLDTRTGEVTLIEGEKLTPIKGATASGVHTNPEAPQVTLPEGGKAWPTLTVPQLGTTSAELTSYWQDGKLHYVLELYPFLKRLKLVHNGYYNNSSFSLILSDTAGKQVARTDLPTERLARVTSSTRNVEELSAEGDIPMTKEDYDSLAGWQLLWNP